MDNKQCVIKISLFTDVYLKVTPTLKYREVYDINKASIFMSKKAANTWMRSVLEKYPCAAIKRVGYVEID